MTVIDVNTGKFTGQGGNLEETVTRNNLEAAEEIVRQLRLRDVGGIIVIDFIDMVLESNRELVLRRLLECLARDRTKHQVAEVTSLGLVQMTRKRVGSGLLEAFSVTCECCNGRGLHVSLEPTELTSPGHRRRGDDKPATEGQAAANGGSAPKGGKAAKGETAAKGGKSAKSGNAEKGETGAKGGNAAKAGDAAKGEIAANGGDAENGGEARPAGGGRRRRRKPAAAAADGKAAENANGNQERAAGPPSSADSEESEGIPAV
jgi:ribonuclease E